MTAFSTSLRARLSAILGGLRDNDEITRKQFADVCDVSLTTAGDWWSGERIPDLEHYASLCGSKRIPLSVKLSIANTVHQGTGLVVGESQAEPIVGRDSQSRCLDCMRGAIDLAEKADAIWRDRVITAHELAEHTTLSNRLRAVLDEMDARAMAATVGPRSAMG